MKLALVIEHFDPRGGGGGSERLAAWLAQEMIRRGHEVHVLCHDVAARVSRFRQATLRASFDAHRSRRAHGSAPEAPHEHLHIHRLEGMRLHTAIGFRLFGSRARSWCRRKNFDVVHSFTVACPGDIYHSQTGVFAAMQAQGAALRGSGPRSAWRGLLRRLPGKQRTLLVLEGRAVARARRILSACAMMTEQFEAHYGTGRAHAVVTLVTPGLDATAEPATPATDRAAAAKSAADRAWFRAHYKIAPADRVALFIGHDFRRKGLRHAIEAIARLPEWKLVVVGLGKVREYVELAGDLGLMPVADPGTQGGDPHPADPPPARVLFVGPTRELSTLYAAGDALLLPTYYEPSGVVALEALAHGLPIVASAFLGVADLIAGNAAGTIVANPSDIAALAAGLAHLPSPGTREAGALAARARAAAASLSTAAFADRMEALYREVLREKAE